MLCFPLNLNHDMAFFQISGEAEIIRVVRPERVHELQQVGRIFERGF